MSDDIKRYRKLIEGIEIEPDEGPRKNVDLNINLSKSWLNKDTDGLLTLDNTSLRDAKKFALVKWQQRTVERLHFDKSKPFLEESLPKDLSYSCKFSSLFIKILFGGKIKGNYNHQFNVIDGRRIDISSDSADVNELRNKGVDPYLHDTIFFGKGDHLDSLRSCFPRVKEWVEEFMREHTK